jgi:carbon monoxide dehydrogenase subunit G
MPEMKTSIQLPVSVEKAWGVVSDLGRYEEWMTIHKGWKSELPTEIQQGTQVTEVISLMGMDNKVEWTFDEYEPLHSCKMSGTGLAGVKASIELSVAELADATEITIDAIFEGQMLVGAIGQAIEKNVQLELEKSLAQLHDLLV